MSKETDEIDTQVAISVGEGFKLRSKVIRVEVCDGPDNGRIEKLNGPSVRVGSGAGCDLRLQDTTVSRHHLTLQVDESNLRVVDSGSRNGTTLDGVRIRDAYCKPDSQIRLGNTTIRLKLLSDLIDIPISKNDSFGGLLGKSTALRHAFSILERIAPTDHTVLIEGESGTGKELAAEGIHELSQRSDGAFVVFDCSAVSANLIESELFGHLRGAFTGAISDRQGAFEAANGGTLFLDEIGELPLDLQPKLLRVLEKLEVRRIGENNTRSIDVRIVAATNRSLSAEVDAGRFREDLFYRLAVIQIRLPPLRERPEDIPLLAQHFCSLAKGTPLGERTLKGFSSQSWPGNVRELRNAVMRSISLGSPIDFRSTLESIQLPPRNDEPLAIDLSVPLKTSRDALADEFEKRYLQAALVQSGGNISKAAQIAGVSRKFIQRAMKKHDIRES